MADTLEQRNIEQTEPENMEAKLLPRPARLKLTEEEVIARVQAFDQRKEKFIASVRKSKD